MGEVVPVETAGQVAAVFEGVSVLSNDSGVVGRRSFGPGHGGRVPCRRGPTAGPTARVLGAMRSGWRRGFELCRRRPRERSLGWRRAGMISEQTAAGRRCRRPWACSRGLSGPCPGPCLGSEMRWPRWPVGLSFRGRRSSVWMPPVSDEGEVEAPVEGIAGGGQVVLRSGAAGRHDGAAVGGIDLGHGRDVVEASDALVGWPAGHRGGFDQVVDDVIAGDFDEVGAVQDDVWVLVGQGETTSFGTMARSFRMGVAGSTADLFDGLHLGAAEGFGDGVDLMGGLVSAVVSVVGRVVAWDSPGVGVVGSQRVEVRSGRSPSWTRSLRSGRSRRWGARGRPGRRRRLASAWFGVLRGLPGLGELLLENLAL